MSDTLKSVFESVYLPQKLRIRSEKTVKEYHLAFRDFARCLLSEPTLDDLNDSSVSGYMRYCLARGLAAKTINERRGRLLAIWTWLAKRGIVSRFPTVEKLPEPERIPVAWDRDQMEKLFSACRAQQGEICGVNAGDWWLTLHAVAWNTGERIGSLRRLQWDWVDLKAGLMRVPAHARKAGRKPAFYRLWPEVVELLAKIRFPRRSLVFAFDACEGTLYNRYRRLRRKAGLTTDRYSAFHRLRVSHASWLAALGGNPTEALGHESAATTRQHYIDPAVAQVEGPRLFWPKAG